MQSKSRITGLLLILFLLSSCHHKNQLPRDIIPNDSLVCIIVDLHLADAVLLNQNTQSKISDISSNALYQSVLTKYHITKERFVNSMNYFAEKPEVLDSIYDKVIERLSLIQSKGYDKSKK
jgi:hypothetical protein